MWWVLTGLVVSLASLIEVFVKLDLQRIRLQGNLFIWLFSFVILHFCTAAIFSALLDDAPLFNSLAEPQKSLAMALSCLVFLNSKVISFNWKQEEIPFGVEYPYTKVKAFFHGRLNIIIINIDYQILQKTIGDKTVEDLYKEAKSKKR